MTAAIRMDGERRARRAPWSRWTGRSEWGLRGRDLLWVRCMSICGYEGNTKLKINNLPMMIHESPEKDALKEFQKRVSTPYEVERCFLTIIMTELIIIMVVSTI